MLDPRASLTLGRARYDTHAASVSVTLGLLPAAGAARVRLPAGLQVDAAPGDDAVLVLDSGEDEQTVITGTLRAVRRGLHGTEVVLVGAGTLLAELRPAATYEAMSAGDVIRRLAADAGADVQVSGADAELPFYVAHPGRTAAEHVAFLARICGCLAWVDAAGALTVRAIPQDRPELALRFGRELLSCDETERPAPVAFARMGSGPAGSASAPDALVPSFDRLPASAPTPGAGARWIPSPVLRTADAASAASDAESLLRAAASQEVHATCFLLPSVRPGIVLEVQELPDPLAGGPWLVTRVRHELHPRSGARTVFEGWTAGAGGLLGALGGLP